MLPSDRRRGRAPHHACLRLRPPHRRRQLVPRDREPDHPHARRRGHCDARRRAAPHPDGGIDIDRIRAYVASRLHLIPRYRQRLADRPARQPPGLGRRRALQHRLPRAPHEPAAAGRRAAAEAPRRPASCRSSSIARSRSGRSGSSRASRATASRMVAQDPPLHGRRHLGRRPAGGAARARRRRRADFTPGRPGCRGRRRRRCRCCRDEMAAPRSASRSSSWRDALPGPLRRRRIRAGHLGRRERASARRSAPRLRPASATPLNRPIGPHRRFDWLTIDLDDVKAVKNRLGGTVNDVVLATVAGAVRRFLERRRVNVDVPRLPRQRAGQRAHRRRARHARQPRRGLDGRPAGRRARSARAGSTRCARPPRA